MMVDYKANVLVMRRWIRKILLIVLLIFTVGVAASCSKQPSETSQLETAEVASKSENSGEEPKEATGESQTNTKNDTAPIEVTQIIK